MAFKDEEQRLLDRLIAHDQDTENDVGSVTIDEELAQAQEFLDKINRFAAKSSFPSTESNSKEDRDKFAKSDAKKNCLPTNIGRFEIKRQIGIGGFGIVFQAYDSDLDRDVAIKILRPECMLVEAHRMRFEREAQLAATLNHPAIVPVFETGVDGPVRFIVFGYVAGENMAQWLSSHEDVFAVEDAAALVAHVAEAVGVAHRHGILHRDLKPANLLIENGNDTSVTNDELIRCIRIADFGLAIDVLNSSRITGSDVMLGTPIYTAPELLTENGFASPASDVYSLGIILYELLAGRPPFESDSSLKLLRNIHEKSPARFQTIKDSKNELAVPRDLEAICFKCLNKEPELRYRSAVELHEDLERFFNGEAVKARPVTAISQMARWAKRKPLVASLIGTVAALLIIVAVGGGWAAYELSKSNDILASSFFDSLVDQSRLTRQSVTSGRRTKSLEKIRSAAEMLDASDPRALTLRNEVLACLSLNDVDIERSFEVPHDLNAKELDRIAFDEKLNRVALETDGKVSVLSLETGELLAGTKVDGELKQLLFGNDAHLIWQVQVPATGQFVIQNWSVGSDEICDVIRLEGPAPIRKFGDGEIAVGDHRIRLIDMASGTLKKEWRLGETPVDGFEFSPTQKILATWHGNFVQVWELDEVGNFRQSERFEHSFNPDLQITSLSWSPDETKLATCTSAHSTHVWSLEWGESRHREFAGHEGWVYRAVFDSTKPFLTTASSDGTSRIWNYDSGELLMVCDGTIVDTNDSDELLAGFTPGRVVVWRRLVNEVGQLLRNEECGCLVASNNGIGHSVSKRVLISAPKYLNLYESDLGIPKFEIPNENEIASVFSGDGRFVFWTCGENLYRLCCETGVNEPLISNVDLAPIIGDSLSANCDGSLIGFATTDNQCVLNCDTKTCRERNRRVAGERFYCFHPDKSIVAVPKEDGISIENYETGCQIEFFDGVETPIRFSPDGKFLVAGSNGKVLAAWLGSATITKIFDTPFDFSADQIAVSEDGTRVALAGYKNEIVVVEIRDRQAQQVLHLPAGATQSSWVAFHENLILSSTAEMQVIQFDIEKLKVRLRQFDLAWD